MRFIRSFGVSLRSIRKRNSEGFSVWLSPIDIEFAACHTVGYPERSRTGSPNAILRKD